jgi:hypothetical protein
MKRLSIRQKLMTSLKKKKLLGGRRLSKKKRGGNKYRFTSDKTNNQNKMRIIRAKKTMKFLKKIKM